MSQQTLLAKRIVLGICGGIAAYKSAELIRALRRCGADVRVIMTRAAREFITPLTLQTLSTHRVHDDLLDSDAELAMGHIELARWADAIVIAPATANTLANLAQGKADDLLTTVCLASKAPLLIAPAMNQQMWAQAVTQDNIQCLRQRSATIVDPTDGEQACGDVGVGRMAEPETIVEQIIASFAHQGLLGKSIVITAGATREPIDPVRYLSNHSSGKMGFALAQACIEAGAKVTLVTGINALPTPDKVTRIDVETAQQMYDTVLTAVANTDIFIAAAAVSDYRVAHPATKKIKKTADELTLQLIRNPDILATIAQLPQRPFCVGFCLETHDLEHYAKQKLINKNLDIIIANRVAANQGFATDTNKVSIIDNYQKIDLPLQSKTNIAREIITHLSNVLKSSK